MPLTEYYQIKDSELMIILQDKIYDKSGIVADGIVYIDYDTIKMNLIIDFIGIGMKIY